MLDEERRSCLLRLCFLLKVGFGREATKEAWALASSLAGCRYASKLIGLLLPQSLPFVRVSPCFYPSFRRLGYYTGLFLLCQMFWPPNFEQFYRPFTSLQFARRLLRRKVYSTKLPGGCQIALGVIPLPSQKRFPAALLQARY